MPGNLLEVGLMAEAATLTLGDAVTRFMTINVAKHTPEIQTALQKFVRWSGRERILDDLTPRDVEAYSETLGPHAADRLAPLKNFFAYAKKENLTETNLGIHARAKRGPAGPKPVKTPAVPVVQMTAAGQARAQSELDELKQQRVQVAGEIGLAMADKDFRENAPLDAAREKQGHLEARIREIEHNLRYAEIVADDAPINAKVAKARVGSSIVVRDLTYDEELSYVLVNKAEADTRQGRISVESPAGKAFLARSKGDVVKVNAPGGAIEYRIEQVES